MCSFEFLDLCTIKRRKETTVYGGMAADEYNIYATEVPCLFIEESGTIVTADSEGRDIVTDGTLRLWEQIYITDTIVIGNYEYKILLVNSLRDRITNTVKYYRAKLQKMKKDVPSDEPVIK